MYINEFKIKKTKLKNAILLVIGIIGLIIFGGTFIFVLIDDEYKLSETIPFIVFTLFSGLIIYKSIRSNALIDSVYFYSRYFEGDLDGYINTSDMFNVIGKSEKKINSDLSKLLKKKYMTNFMLKNKRFKYTGYISKQNKSMSMQ